MSQLIISVSGLRGIVGETLTPEVAVRYVACFCEALDAGPVVVGRDGRTTGPMLHAAVVSAIAASGREVVDADVIATPTLGVLVRKLGAAGGIQISASHNPAPYNGLKLFGSDGRVLDAASGGVIAQRYRGGEVTWCPFDQVGHVGSAPDPHGPHLDAVLRTVDVEAIAGRGYRVLLDSNHGAGGVLGQRLLQQLGCDVVLRGAEPTGRFAHPPEPTAENLAGVAKEVASERCAVGFCQDPDADRLALIDERGRYIGEEATLALCVRRAMEVGRTGGPIVINGATSSMSARIAAEYSVDCHRSAVGEANVCDKMIATDAVYGGEGNGGPIDPEVGYVRDSFVGMAAVLDLMTRSGKTLGELADELPASFLCKEKAPADSGRLPEIFQQLEAQFADAKADHGDGLRLAWPDKWLLVRGSNTEPIVRMIAEAEDAETAAALCQTARQWIEGQENGRTNGNPRIINE